MRAVSDKEAHVAEIKQTMNNFAVEPALINPYFETIQSAALTEKQKASKIILRINVSLENMKAHLPELAGELQKYTEDELLQAEIQIKYERYIEKEQQLVDKMSDLENMKIPAQFEYDKLTALSNEAMQKLKKIQPATLGQASRISGVNPSDIQILMVYMGR